MGHLLEGFVVVLAAWTLAYWAHVAAYSLALVRAVRVDMLLLTFVLLVLLAILLFRRAPRHADQRASSPLAMTTVAWSAGFAILAATLVRPDADDIVYVGRSAWVAERGTIPFADTIFSDGRFPALPGTDPPLPSWEALLGAIARLATLDAGTVTYVIAPPLLAALAITALSRLIAEWGPPLPNVALSAACLFLLFGGEAHGSFGNLHAGRIWQGKVLIVALLIPYLLAESSRYLRTRAPRSLIAAGAASIAMIGSSTTGIFLLPLLIGIVTAITLVHRATRPLAWRFALLSLPALFALLWLRLDSPAIQLTPGLAPDWRSSTRLVFGTGVAAAGTLTLALVGAWGLRKRIGTQVAFALMACAAVLLSPPVVAAIDSITGSGPVLWRMAWLVPVPALVGAGTTYVARHAPGGGRGQAVAIATILLGISAIGVPLWDQDNAGANLGAPNAWKLDADDRASAELLAQAAGHGGIILAPSTVSYAVSVTTSRAHPVVSRPAYVSILGNAAPAFHPWERWQLERIANGTATNDDTAESVRLALDRLNVTVACVDESARALLLGAGWTRTGRTASCDVYQDARS